ncbi:MAG: limonene 1,2-monooxygenase, partial [Ilumatobacteraceae bacterium]
PDDLIQAINNLQKLTGGFGVVLGFAHDWANRENARRSWDMVARYVIPAVNGSVTPMQASADYVEANKAELMGGASAAVMSKILAHEGAAAAMATTMAQMAERAAKRNAHNEEPGNDPAFRPGAGLPNPQS